MKSEIAQTEAKKYTLLMLLTAIIWGFGFIVTENALRAGYSTGFILLFRFSVTAAVFGIISREQIRNTTRPEIIGGTVSGIFLFLGFMLQTTALPLTTPSNNAFLTVSNVMFIPLFIWIIFKQPPTKKVIIAGIVCLSGIFILAANPSDLLNFGIGDILTIMGAVSFALQNVFVSYSGSRGRVDVVNFFQMLVAGVLAFVFFMATDRDFTQFIPRKELLWVVYLILFSTLFAYIIQGKALQVLSAPRVGIISSFESVAASVFSVMLGYEKLTSKLIIGGSLVFLSIIIVELPKTVKRSRLQ